MKVLFWMGGGFDRRTPSEHLLVAIVEMLYKQGHTVHTMQKNTGGPLPPLPKSLVDLGVTTEVISCRTPKKKNFIARYLTDVAYVCACRKRIRKTDGYDAVFVQSTNVAGAAVGMIRRRLGKVPITFNVQDIFPYNAAFSGNLTRKGLPFKLLAAWQRQGYKKADHIITISEDMKDLLISDGVAPEKIQTIYNWSYRDEPYDLSMMNEAEIRKLLPDGKCNVVYAGNIGVMQNVEILIDTAAMMQDEEDVLFHIIGDGAYREKLEAKAAALSLSNVRFHDMLNSDLAPALYATADVNIIPLVKEVYKTALPSKTATCFACGKPIVLCIGTASRFAQMAQKETGCGIVESDDSEGLKNAILRAKAGHDTEKYGRFFTTHMEKTRNSEKYADIITSSCVE